MSNIKSARDAIRAELNHAREGAAYYQSRVEALEEALAKIDDLEAAGTPNGKSRPMAETGTKGKRGRPAKKSAPKENEEEKLPSTGKNFWPDLITQHPQSAPEILTAAIRSLGITPSKGQTKKLAQRQANALSLLTKSGAIASSGSGRERRFFKK